jgi:uncharacterized protein
MKRTFLFLAVGILLAGQNLVAQTEIPRVEQRVNDFTNTLTFNEWKSIENLLKRFEDSTSTQIVVLMVDSLNGQPIEDYAVKVFEKNKIGQAQKDNGVLLVIAKDDRKTKIEVGYGLEGVLTDITCEQIIDREMIPQFKDANFYGGILTGVTSIMSAVGGEYKAEPKGKAAPAISGALVIMFLLFFFYVLLPLVASRRRTIIGSGNWNHFSGWGYGGFWGGGFGGGLGGGIGGGMSGGGWSGGGGMSGGGGATGSW